MSGEVYNEFNAAVWMANKALDVAWADPDDDLRTVSRQFLRLAEQNASLKLELQKQKELNAELVKAGKELLRYDSSMKYAMTEKLQWSELFVEVLEKFESLIKKSNEI